MVVSLAAVVGALAVGVVSPGPSFVMVAQVAVSASRGDGLAAALGMGAGGACFGLAAPLGLPAVLLALPAVYVGLKLLGGLYLAYRGWHIFAGTRQALDVEVMANSAAAQRRPTQRRSFWLGLTTQLSNPKTAIVYASVFAAFLPATFSLAFALILLCLVFLTELVWYGVVALLLSSARPRQIYLGRKTWVDRTAGVVMVGLGLKLVLSLRQACDCWPDSKAQRLARLGDDHLDRRVAHRG